MGSDNIAMRYTLRLVKTESGTGYFSYFPEEDHDFDALACAMRGRIRMMSSSANTCCD